MISTACMLTKPALIFHRGAFRPSPSLPPSPPPTHNYPPSGDLRGRRQSRGPGGAEGGWGGTMSWSDRFKRVKLVAFSLRVQMHTYPPAVALRLLSPVPPSSERPTLSSFIDPPPPFPSHPHPPPPTLCAQVWTFYIYFSGTDMEHLRGRRGCCGTAWTAWILPTGKCVFTTCERVFFFSTHSRCDFFFSPFHKTAKTIKKIM